jgi:hypothetical protein
MDSTIKRILGEADDELEKPEALRQAPEQPGAAEPVNGAAAAVGPEDAEIEELANMWNSGNKGEVVRRFQVMDNEVSVKLVFAIGLEGALELARIVDQQMENAPQEDEAASSEPERVEPPPGDDTVREIIGRPHVMPP